MRIFLLYSDTFAITHPLTSFNPHCQAWLFRSSQERMQYTLRLHRALWQCWFGLAD